MLLSLSVWCSGSPEQHSSVEQVETALRSSDPDAVAEAMLQLSEWAPAEQVTLHCHTRALLAIP